MSSSVSESVTPEPWKKPAKAKVTLIAWDPESPEHIERMVQQRIACGWKADYVEIWRDLQRKGKMALQWVVSIYIFFLRNLHCRGPLEFERRLLILGFPSGNSQSYRSKYDKWRTL
jgi:hypothetical protein